MRKATAQDPHHHGLDHAKREQRSDRGIGGIAALQEHLHRHARGDRMIGHRYAARAAHRLPLALESKPTCGKHGGRHCAGAGSGTGPELLAERGFQHLAVVVLRQCVGEEIAFGTLEACNVRQA